ncbi:nucleoside monophosphate kinase [bacterium]|nr:MAG: nucleoside monophosphate kinase [bacterium]
MGKIYSIIGKSGCGKGTQAKLLSESIKSPIIVMSDLLRKEIEAKTDLSRKVREMVENGIFIPGDIIQTITEKYIPDNFLKNGFIFDGSNRTISQTIRFDYYLWKQGLEQTRVFLLDISDEVALERRIARNEDALKLGKQIRQDDADLRIFQNRLKEYAIDFEIIEQYFGMNNKLVKIDGDADIYDIHDEIMGYI